MESIFDQRVVVAHGLQLAVVTHLLFTFFPERFFDDQNTYILIKLSFVKIYYELFGVVGPNVE